MLYLIPGSIAVVQLFLFLFVYTQESPLFALQNNDDSQCAEAIKRLYKDETSLLNVFANLQKSFDKVTSTHNLIEKTQDHQLRRFVQQTLPSSVLFVRWYSSQPTVGLIALRNGAGYYVILMFSTPILTSLDINPVFTLVIGVFAALGALLCLLLIDSMLTSGYCP